MSYLAKRDAAETRLEVENRKIAYQAALEGMVLLENDGTLPFCDVKRIALFGNGARKTVKGGTGSGDVNERACISVEQGLKNAGYQIVTEDWLDRYDRVWDADRIRWKNELEEIAEHRKVPFVIAYLETLHLLPTMDIQEEEIKEADAAVYVIARRSGEGIDRVAEKGDYYQYCTAFPIGTMLAQTWNEEICREVGRAVGKEMNEFGVHIWLAPSINIHRNPLCGRNFEYYSEDPLVTGKMAAAVCMGVQENPQAAVTIKHFAANNQELYRHSSDSIVSERALREIYLKPFEIVVKTAHPLTIMTSYNRLNGIQTANRRELCTTVVREEWGFDGFLMTDWGTTDPGDSDPVVCIQCGNDLVMLGGENDRKRLTQAVEEGRLERKELELAAGHIAGVIRRLRS